MSTPRLWIIRQTGRYGPGFKSAPEVIEIEGGSLNLARHVAHTVQEWGWPGQEHMFEVLEDQDPEGSCQDCPCLRERRRLAARSLKDTLDRRLPESCKA